MIDFVPYTEFYPVGSFILDYLDHRDHLNRILPHHFGEAGDFVRQAENLAGRAYPRESVATVLREQNMRYGAGEVTLAHIDQLRNPASLVVIGGQQPGLFGGPLYTLYKALSVIKLAQSASMHLQRNVLPVFWVAADDHDFREVNHIYLPDQNGTPRRVEDARDFTEQKLPLSQIRLPEDVEELIGRIRQWLPETEFSAAIFRDLLQAYQPGRSYPDAFAIWLLRLLGKYGLIVVNPADARLKRLAVPLFEREIREKSPVTRAVMKTTRLLEECGYRPQIHLQENILNLFYHTPGRETLVLTDSGVAVKNLQKKFSENELLQLLREHPERFSPNVALRPLFQDTLFPTLATVLGPSELSYFAQLAGAYRVMDIPMPIAFPRTTLTLIEPRAERIMRKYDLSPLDIFHAGDRLIEKLVKREIPDSLFSTIETGKEMVEAVWQKIVEELTRFDANLGKPAEIARGKSLQQFDFIQKKVVQSAKKKDEILRLQAQRLLELLYPLSKPQERVHNLLPYFVRFGPALLDALFSHMDIFNPRHQVVFLASIMEGKQ